MTNEAIFQRAQQRIPGGVNSPVRAFRAVGGTPRFIDKALGASIWDIEGREYIDYLGSWGPAIVGHAHPEVVQAVQEAASKGLSFGAPTYGEVALAEKICELLPSIEKVRLVSSGTEATMSAIRLARGATGREKIIKFEGCYHGHSDSLLVQAGSGLLTFGNPSSAGVPADFTQHTIVLPYNDLPALQNAFEHMGHQIACIIVEPIAGNMNLVKPLPGFLHALRDLCTQYGSVLIFDEVMTGFRAGPQGVQGLYGIRPDLTTLAKVIGGGMPMGAFGGRADLMDHIAPLGNVYQAGTLSGNPLSVAAGLKTLEILSRPGFYEQLSHISTTLIQGLQTMANKHAIPFCADNIGGMFGLYFRNSIPTTFAQVKDSHVAAFKAFFHHMLDQGVHLAPSAFEAGFVSSAHSPALLQRTFDATDIAFGKLATQLHEGTL